MNKLMIIGNLTHEPERRTTSEGFAVCNFSVAVNRRTAGEKKTDYYRATAWRELAEHCAKYLRRGSRVCVIGELTPEIYSGTDHQARLRLEVRVETIEFLGGAGNAAE